MLNLAHCSGRAGIPSLLSIPIHGKVNMLIGSLFTQLHRRVLTNAVNAVRNLHGLRSSSVACGQ